MQFSQIDTHHLPFYTAITVISANTWAKVSKTKQWTGCKVSRNVITRCHQLFVLAPSFHTFLSISFPSGVPCCLLFWDGVKLELELELELAGLGCSDSKEKKKKINNIVRNIFYFFFAYNSFGYCLRHAVKKTTEQKILSDLQVPARQTFKLLCTQYTCTLYHVHALLKSVSQREDTMFERLFNM